MVENSFLFHALDIDWYLRDVLFVCAGFFILIVGGLLLTYVLIRSGRRRPLTPSELATLGRTPNLGDVRMQWSGARGAKIEATASIDTLRRAAKRRDWALFLAWPCLMSSVGIGFGLMVAGFALSDPENAIFLFIIAGICALPFVGVGLFMPWAALYTNIDLGVDGPDLYAPAPESPPSETKGEVR